MEIALLVATSAVFVALSVGSVLRYRRLGQRAGRFLALVFGGMAAAATGGLGLALDGGGEDPVGFVLLLTVGILGYMTALWFFGDTLEPVSTTSKVLIAGVSVALLVLIAGLFITGQDSPAADLVYRLLIFSLLVIWTVVHVVVARSVWRSGGRLSSALARIRARNMVIGVVGLGAAMLFAFVPPIASGAGEVEFSVPEGETEEDTGAVSTAMTLAALAAVMLSLGFAPPRWLRLAWTRHEQDQLVSAELALQREPTAEVLAEVVLPEVCRIVSGTAAWLVRHGEVVARHGVDADDIVPIGVADRETVTVVRIQNDWYLVAPVKDGALVVRTHEEPVLYGIEDVDGLLLLAVRIVSILGRADVDRREAESRARLAEAKHVERITSLKDDVLSTLSHELRTPLVTLCGVSETLRQRWELLDDQQRGLLIERIESNAGDLRALVEDTLDLATMRTAGVTISPRPYRVRAVLDSVLADSRVGAAGRSVWLDVPEDLQVVTDGAALGRILRQLVMNACKFSSRGEPIEIRGRSTDGTVRLSVADQGVGIPQHEAEQVFEPFFRSGNVLTRDTRGLGVGLTLVAETVRQLGGEVEVESAPGKGSTFTVVLPAPDTGVLPAPDTGVLPAPDTMASPVPSDAVSE